MAKEPNKKYSEKYDQVAVDKYHKKLTNIIVRIPSKEACGVDYKEQINEYLKKSAKNGEKPKSMNEYILSLIEKDSGITIHRGAKGLSVNKD